MSEERIYIYDTLPAEVQEFFLDSGLEDIDKIGVTYGLSQDAVDELDVIQQDILFGYESLDSIENLIRVRLGLDTALVRKVSLDMIRARFLPIDSYMGSRAYRTYAHLGGDPALTKIKRIDGTGGTVADVRKANDEAVTEIMVRKAQAAARVEPLNPEVDLSISGIVEDDPETKAEQDKIAIPDNDPVPDVEVASKSAPADKAVPPPPKPDTKPTPVVVQIKPPVKTALKPVSTPVAPQTSKKNDIVEIVRSFDAKLDSDHPSIKGEKRELAPPPPVIIDTELPATKKDVGPMVTFKAKKVQSAKSISEAPVTRPKKRLKRRSDVVIKAKKHETVDQPKDNELFPDIAQEVAAQSTMRDLRGSGQKAPMGLENSKIDEVQRRLTLTFPSSELDKRFRVILGARFSGVRSAVDFKNALVKPIEKGGLALNEHTVSRVIDEVESAITGEHNNAYAKQQKEKAAMVKNAQKKYGSVGVARDSGSSVKTTEKRYEPKQSSAKTVLSPASVSPSTTASGKTPVTDVTYKKRLVGPIEEFRRLNIDDFRRLPGDIDVVTENLMEDINVLGHGDPGLRIRAIEAWRSSPLVVLYQRLISSALQTGEPIGSVLENKTLNPKGMTKEELDAVRKLNSTLRY